MEFKICSVCNYKNEVDAEFCVQCDADITSIEPTSDFAIERKKEGLLSQQDSVNESEPVVSTHENNSSDNFFRICDECGYINPSYARKCMNPGCNNDISNIQPVRIEEEHSCCLESEPRLYSEDGIVSFTIPEGETIIGRENALQSYLKNRLFVAREQGKFIRKNGIVFYENLSKSNGTVINGIKISAGRIQLNDGDKIYFGYNPLLSFNDSSNCAFFVFRK